MPRKQHTHHYIYKTTCAITENYYIGMHSTSNLEDGYIGSGKRLWNSIRKYGKENHVFEILEFLPDRKSLSERESQLVNSETLRDPHCMNLIHGGEFAGTYGFKFSEESRKRMSAWKRTPERSAKISLKTTGQKRTPEQRTFMSQQRKGHVNTPEHNRNIGIASANRSDETRKKLSESRKKWKISKETSAKIVETRRANKRAELEKIRIGQFDIHDNLLIREWKNIYEIIDAHPKWKCCLQMIFNNIENRIETAYKFKWKKL
jgi:hypothetical protein